MSFTIQMVTKPAFIDPVFTDFSNIFASFRYPLICSHPEHSEIS